MLERNSIEFKVWGRRFVYRPLTRIGAVSS